MVSSLEDDRIEKGKHITASVLFRVTGTLQFNDEVNVDVEVDALAGCDSKTRGKSRGTLVSSVVGASDAFSNFFNTMFYGVAAVCSGSFVMAIMSSEKILVDASMVLGLFNSLHVVRNTYILSDRASVRTRINALRISANRFTRQNEKLATERSKLQKQCDRVKEKEGALEEILKKQGKTSADFTQRLKENKEVMSKMREALKAQAVQEIIETVVKSDRDGDFKIDPEEIDQLIVRLELEKGVTINAENFRKKMCMQGSSIFSVLKLIDSVNDDDDHDVLTIDMRSLCSMYT